MRLETNPVIQLQMQGANSKNTTFRIIIKSHIMSIVKVQSVAPVHFRVGRRHQMKKRHCMWLLSKVFTDLEKVFSLKWRCPPREAFHWWRGECSADPAVRPIVPQLSYPFVCWLTSRLHPCPSYCKQCWDEHWGTCVSFTSGFLSVYAQQWDCWVIWQFYFQFFKESPHCSP